MSGGPPVMGQDAWWIIMHQDEDLFCTDCYPAPGYGWRSALAPEQEKGMWGFYAAGVCNTCRGTGLKKDPVSPESRVGWRETVVPLKERK